MSGYLISPDPPSKATRLNGAVFLFFDPPFSVSIALGTAQLRATRLAVLVRERRPEWAETFWGLCTAHDRAMGAVEAYKRDLEPIDACRTAPDAARSSRRRHARRLFDDCDLGRSDSRRRLPPLQPNVAAVDILAFLNIQAFDMCGQDSEALYRYCGDYLRRRPLRLIAAAYVSRLRLQLARPPEALEVVLADDRARRLLLGVPLNPKSVLSDAERRRQAAWEFFAEVLRPYLQPLDQRRSRTIARLLTDRSAEVARLRSKSYELAGRLQASTSQAELSAELEHIMRTEVDEEVGALLDLDKAARRNVIVTLLADKVAWTALTTAMFQAITGHELIAVCAALPAIATVPATVFAEAKARRERIESSDYALVYRMRALRSQAS
jgi:hypothetical protein